MPQITLQYTANINQKINYKAMFAEIHGILSDIGKINIGNCKSRAVKLDEYYIAQGEKDNAFIHLEVKFMEGRPDELKQDLGRQILDVLIKFYGKSIDKCSLQVTVEILDLKRNSYFKYPEGSFSAV